MGNIIRKIIYLSLGIIDTYIIKQRNQIVILSYHSVAADNWKYGVSFSTLKNQINYLKKKFDFISLSDLHAYILGEKTIRRPSLVVTFDDGYKDILQTREYFKIQKINPTLFLIADTKDANYKELATKRPFLNKQEVLSLVNSGWEIGSHTNTHANLRELNEKVMREEVINSKITLEKFFSTVTI